MRRSLVIFAAYASAPVAIVGLVAGCASHRVGPTTGRELVELDDAWAAYAARGDIDAVMGFWTEDAAMYPEGQPPLYGKQAIREFHERCRSRLGCRMVWTPSCAGVDANGQMAYTVGESVLTVVDGSGVSRDSEGRYVAIWRWDGGSWRCAVKCWNASPRECPAGPGRLPVTAPLTQGPSVPRHWARPWRE